MFVDELIRVDADHLALQSRDGWHAQMQQTVQGIVQDSPLDRLGGEMLAFNFSGARLYYMHSDLQRISRAKPSAQSRFTPMVIIPLEGAPLSISQLGRGCDVQAGQFALIDAAAPLNLIYNGEFRQLYLNFPASSFVPAPFHRLVARSFSAQSDFDETFIRLVRAVWRDAEHMRPEEHGAALNTILSLCDLTTPFREMAQNAEPCIRVRRAMGYIEHNLAETWLTPKAVADAQKVSRRYLDDLFGRLGLRIERWIWERRLLRAREELEIAGRAPAGRGKSIIHVALDTGFKSPCHFSRSFSERFGSSPRDYRNAISGESKAIKSASH